MYFHLLRKLAIAICLLGLFPSWGVAMAEGPGNESPAYTVGVVPQFAARKLRKIWQPILNELEKRTGYRFKMVGSPTIPAFETEFMSGNFDFAYMNPYHLMLAAAQEGYIPLARDVGRTLHGVLVIRADSEIKKITDLDGKTLAFPAPNALGASLLMRQELADKFGITIKPVYVKSHDSVYLNVLLKKAAAGGGVQKTLNRQKEDFKKQLKVIHRTTAVSPHPLAVHPRVPEKVQQAVKEALLAMGASEGGKKLLAKVPMKKIGRAALADYAPLGNMGLERFFVKSH